MTISAVLGGIGAVWIIAAIATEGCSDFVKLETDFNATRYTGLWYEHARDENIKFEKGHCQQARYRDDGELASDGRLTVINSQHKDGSFDTVKGFAECEGGQCSVEFKWFVPKGDYRIVATDYDNYSVVYSCSKILGIYKVEFAWILGRTQQLQDSIRSNAYDLLKSRVPDYDTTRLKKTN